MNPSNNNRPAAKNFPDLSDLLPSDLFIDDEHISIDSQNISDSFDNCIVETREPENKEINANMFKIPQTLFTNNEPFEYDFSPIKTPKTRYSDSRLMSQYHPMASSQYQNTSPVFPQFQPLQPVPKQQDFNHSFCQMPMNNYQSPQQQQFVTYSPQTHFLPHPINYQFDFEYQQQQMLQNQLFQNNFPSQNYLDMRHYKHHERYASNDCLGMNMNLNMNDSFSSLGEKEKEKQEELKGPSRKKYNSSGNVTSNITCKSPTSKKGKNSERRNRSSLFVSHKAEYDLRDFKRFCDGLKCDLHQYICTQVGSRIMQKYLKKFPPEIMTLMINKLSIYIPKIMIDVYGNYFCQGLINIASNEQRILILQSIKDYFYEIAKEKTGTHALQKILEIMKLKEEEDIILSAIRNHELELAYNDEATHVLQKIIVRIDELNRKDLNQILLNNFRELSLNNKGLCVAKRFIKESTSDDICNQILAKISENFFDIIESPYGNYVIQYIIEEWGMDKCSSFIPLIISNLTHFSMQKFSSNVVEKVYNQTTKENQQQIIKELFSSNTFNSLAANKFGKTMLKNRVNAMSNEQSMSIYKDLCDKVKDTSTVKGKTRLQLINDIFS